MKLSARRGAFYCAAALLIGPVSMSAAASALAAGAPALPEEASPAPGALSLTLASTSLGEGGRTTLLVSNTGESPLDNVRLKVSSPPGITTSVHPATIDLLAPNSSVLATISSSGIAESLPATIDVSAVGTSGAGDTAAVGSIELVRNTRSVSMEISGGTRITDTSPADLIVTLTNGGGAPADVALTATAPPNSTKLAATGEDLADVALGEPMSIVLPPAESRIVVLEVIAAERLRRGNAPVVVSAQVAAPEGTYQLTTSATLEASYAADSLPAPLGTTAVFIVPGVVAVWAALMAWYMDRRRMGLDAVRPGPQLWDNKLWLILGVGVSIAMAWCLSSLGLIFLLDSYSLGDLIEATLLGGALGFAVGIISVSIYRLRRPMVNGKSNPMAVLSAASKGGEELRRPVYITGEGHRGLLVHHDRGVPVLTPIVSMSEMRVVSDLVDGGEADLASILSAIGAIPDHGSKLWFAETDGYVRIPGASPDATFTGETRPALEYDNPREG